MWRSRSLVMFALILCFSAIAFAQLPTGAGWFALPNSTAMSNSGACPPNGFGGDTFAFANSCRNVIRAWSGAVADTDNNRLLLFGGGGTNYYGNEIYSLNLGATPVTFTRLKDPTIPTNFATSGTCAESLGGTDFAPNSRTSYDGISYIPGAKRLFVFGGILACGGSQGTQNTWTIGTATLSNATAWQHMDPTIHGTIPGANGGGTVGASSDYDPNSGKVIVADGGALFTYDYTTNTYRQITANFGFLKSYYVTGAVDPVHRLFVAMGNCPNGSCTSGNGVLVADISDVTGTTALQNWTNATLADTTCKEFLSGGSAPIQNGAVAPGLAFDTVGQTLVGWPNSGNSVYLITPDMVNKKMSCQKLTFAGGPPNSAQSYLGANSTNGTFGRFRYFPGLDVFAVINDFNIPAYFLRIRDNSVALPTITVSPASLTFANQVLNTTSSSQTVTLTSTGTANLSIKAIAVSGDFAQTNDCGVLPATLAPGASCHVAMTFTPTLTGTRTGSLTITDNTTAGTETVGLTGSGVAALVPGVTLSPTSLNFANQVVNTTSGSQPMVLTSSGTATLNLTSIAASGDFAQTNNCPASLAPAAFCTIQVTFKPTATGPRSGSLTIVDNAGTQTPSLTGTGAALALVSIVVTPTNPSITLGSSQQFTATGNFNDGSNQNLTATATWASSNTAAATISASGLANGIAGGTSTISATVSGIQGSTTLTVVNSGLPNGQGWFALPVATALSASGACPPNGFGGDSYQFANSCQNVIRAWSGALADTTNNRLLLFGGGGTNYFGNEIYSLNLMSNPVTLTRIKDPTIPSNFATAATCNESLGGTDFAPNSRTTYDGLAYVANAKRMFVIGGALACNASAGSRNTWTIDTISLGNATNWQHMDPTLQGTEPGANGGGTIGQIAAYDSSSGKVIIADGAALFSYDYPTNTYKQITPNSGFVKNYYLTGEVDPVRKLFVAMGNCPGGTCAVGNGVLVADISNVLTGSTSMQNWTTATLADATCKEFLSGGASPITNGAAAPGLAFDTVGQTLVGWPNSGNSVYLITPDVVNKRMTCQKVTFANGPPNATQTTGTFGRFRYFPGVDAFVLINDYNIPAYVFRLRNSAVPSPAVTFAPPSLTFSGIVINTPSTPQTVTLTNSGTANLTVSSILVSGDYSQTNTCGTLPATLVPNASCTFSVTFTPTQIGTRTGSLSITDNTSAGSHAVSFTGTGTALPVPGATLAPSSLAFGNQQIQTTSTAQTVTITSSGTASLTINTIAVGANFSQTNNCGTLPVSLLPGAFCTVSVKFAPTTTGLKSGTLTVTDNTSAGTETVGLSGTGTAPALTLSPTSLTFGNQNLNTTSAAQTILITSSGTANSVISAIGVSGDYLQSNTCGPFPKTLAPVATCSVAVNFKPTVNGTRIGVLTITDNSAAGSDTANLTGTGDSITLSSIAVTPANPTKIVAGTQQFVATATYSDNSTADVTSSATWGSSNTAVATISATGLATAVASGTSNISATIGAVSGSTLLTVSANSLPTGVGWHSLGTQSSFSGSGACPPNGFGGDTFAFADNCRNIVRAWGGAIADTTANRMLIWGGGHANYYGNEIYSLDLTQSPVTLRRVKDPTVPTNILNNLNCIDSIPPGTSDNAPNSRESYGGLAYIPNQNVMFAVGGSVACVNGFGSWSTWTIPLTGLSNSSLWKHMDPTATGAMPSSANNGYNLGMIADYDPNSGLVIVADSGVLYGYNYQTNNYIRVTPQFGFLMNPYQFGLVDPSRKLFLAIGGLCANGSCPTGSGVFVADISNPTAGTATSQNWTAATLTDPNCSEFLMGGATPLQGGGEFPGLVFDPVANKIVGWPNEGNSVYVITPDTVNRKLSCQKLTFAGGPPNSAHSFLGANSTNGTYNRLRYFPSFDAFLLVNDWNIPAYLLRLR
jgi:Bacterial Ig-like domain (group 2)